MYVLNKYIKQINRFKILNHFSSMAFLRKSGDDIEEHDIEDNDSVESSEEQRDHLRRGILIHRHRICLKPTAFSTEVHFEEKLSILGKYFLGE